MDKINDWTVGFCCWQKRNEMEQMNENWGSIWTFWNEDDEEDLDLQDENEEDLEDEDEEDLDDEDEALIDEMIDHFIDIETEK